MARKCGREGATALVCVHRQCGVISAWSLLGRWATQLNAPKGRGGPIIVTTLELVAVLFVVAFYLTTLRAAALISQSLDRQSEVLRDLSARHVEAQEQIAVSTIAGVLVAHRA